MSDQISSPFEPQPVSESEAAFGGSQNSSFFRVLLHQPIAGIAGGFLLLVVLASIFAPILAPYSPTDLDLPNVLSGPSARHLLGSDDLGRDILSRLMYGGQRAILGVLEGVLTAVVIAVPVGILAGYYGGAFGQIVGVITDAILAIPAIILVLVVLSLFPGNSHAAMITFGLLVAPGFARIIRSVTLPLREADFVAAARVSGVSDLWIMFRHIRPGVTRTAIVQASFISASALLFVVALGYLGLTADSGEAEWGQMVASAGVLINRQPWLLVPSGGLIGLTVLTLTLFGNALRDASAETHAVAMPSKTGSPAAATNEPTDPLIARTEAEPSAALLSVKDLSVAFASRAGNVPVVDQISFEVRSGEVVGLVGESGAGKSITALAILRLLPGGARITGGQVMFEGQDLVALNNNEFDRLRGPALGLVSQEPLSSLDPAFTVGSQLSELVRTHNRVSRRQAQDICRDLLDQVKIRRPEHVLKLYPHEISGGMAQRVAIAMALVGRPKLLIADEPTSALDVTVQKEILALLRQLQLDTGMSVLMVTHNFGVVADVCDRVVVLYAGQVFEQADVFQLFDRPMNPYSSGLLRANPSNVQPGQPLQVIPGRIPPAGSWVPGCRFAPRCPFVFPKCLSENIPLVSPIHGRSSRCIRVGELLQEGAL